VVREWGGPRKRMSAKGVGDPALDFPTFADGFLTTADGLEVTGTKVRMSLVFKRRLRRWKASDGRGLTHL